MRTAAKFTMFSMMAIGWLNLGCGSSLNGEEVTALEEANLGKANVLAKGENQCQSIPQGQIDLPQDTAVHPGALTEWHFWTGHLQAKSGSRKGDWFGVNVIFNTNKDPQSGMVLQNAHYNVTDIKNQTFVSAVELLPVAPVVIPNGFAYAVTTPPGFPIPVGNGDLLTGTGTFKNHELHASYKQDYVLALDVKKNGNSKAPVLLFGDGNLQTAWGDVANQYSMHRMMGNGYLTINGEKFRVRGDVYFNHFWGVAGPEHARMATWLDLDDGTDIFLFELSAPNYATEKGGYIDDANCMTTELMPQDFILSHSTSQQWTSPASGVTYSTEWEIDLQGKKYTLTSLVDNQEVALNIPGVPIPAFWNGVGEVSGAGTGRAVMQMYNFSNTFPPRSYLP